MQVMSPHLATDRRAATWQPSTAGAGGGAGDRLGAGESRAETVASFRRACLIIAAWLLALLLFPILFYQPS
jgi:hypothetical protein